MRSKLFIFILLPLLYSCASSPKEEAKQDSAPEPFLTWQEESLEQQQDAFFQDLMPPVPDVPSAEVRFDGSAKNTPVKAFLLSLVKDTPYNLIVHESLQGEVSLTLNNVTVMETLDAVRDIYGYDYTVSSYGIQVLPRVMQTRIFPINYLNVVRQGSSGMWVSSGQITSTESRESSVTCTTDSTSSEAINSAQVNTQSSADFWRQLNSTLELMLADSEGSSVVVEPHAGIVIVRAMPGDLRTVESFLERAELSVQKQVLIEAKILEVSLNDGFQSGIQWNTFGAGRDASVEDTSRDVVGALTSEALENLDEIGGVFSLNFDSGDFNGVIQLLETQGDVKVLSSPRIATVNNQKAVIKVGNDEYFVTEVKSSTTTGSGGTTSTPEVVFTPFFSGIALDVTPQIGENKDVILHVHPTITEVSEKTKNVELSTGNLTVPLAFSSIRETDSIIKARSGQVVVIGGLMQNQKRQTESGIPYLRDIPLIGWLFGQKRETIVQSELVILIQPKVVDSRFHLEEMERLNKRYSGMYQGMLK